MSLNNESLFQEIEQIVRNTYFEKMLSKRPECVMEFRTRNGHLSIAYENDTEVLVGGIEKRAAAAGMDAAQLDNFLELLHRGLNRHRVINVGDLKIHSITKQGKIIYFTLVVNHHEKMGV
ncbi:hypothetical protein [Paenibacillus abyssi]|uniref:Uncharacterized protein n=1 Tax=Paenibacillus abyssi TaxID=1340531 RepID=A0A917LFG5_9BACL|nr:hypothetical protein [Paenibacillus abyssi]GGG18153.1 hypothetical protein GCM10010916_38690 [Paenibacillus abyssi]